MRLLPIVVLLIAVLSPIALAQTPQAALPLVVLPPGAPPRVFAYTNKEASFYAGVLNGRNGSGFHGITREKQKLSEQYWIRIGGELLDPRTATVTVTPAGFRREYPLHRTVEEVFFADSISLLGVIVRTEFRGDVKIYPALSSWWEDATQSRHGDIYRVFKEGMQGAVMVTGLVGDWDILPPNERESFENPAPVHMPLLYHGKTTGTFGFSFGTFFAGFPPINRDVQTMLRLKLNRERRIARLLAETSFASSDAASTEAFAWVRASMDALVMRQLGAGIYAGLPWFDDYWGRDTFISFPGALLVTGRFETAETVLRSFLRYLDRDTSSSTYGRIPNRIQPRDIIYNTVDGTPWMVIMAWEYYRYSGKRAFMKEILPDIERTIAGAMRHTDEHFLLRHGSAETWMDAVGPDGPWSPRGNRAVDIQALWYAQLRAASNIARVAGDNRRAEGWERFADRVRESVLRLFVDTATPRIADHLNDDGSADDKLRPNILFPFTIPGSDIFATLPDSTVRTVLDDVFAHCVYPYGVASLAQSDTAFHPWHEAARYYPKDAAYHNGTIWTWLTGPAVTVLARRGLADSAFVLTRALERLAREDGAQGAIPENTDALPRDGVTFPRWSGTFSQAWSAAEYLRNWYQDYLGARPDRDGDRPLLRLAPALPQALLAGEGDSVATNVRIGNNWIRLSYYILEGQRMLRLVHHAGGERVTIDTGGDRFELEPGSTREAPYPAGAVANQAWPDSLPLFALPRGIDGIASIAPPAWPRVDGSVATRRPERAEVLCSSFDPEADDRGADGAQRYPTNPLFAEGIADLRWFEVRADKELVYFTIRMRRLTQPGWHPEYGFQLSMIAIAIDQSHDITKQSRDLGHNSGFTLPEGRGFDRLITVGGGVRVTDAAGTVLCEFVPETVADAFGSVASGEIRFALPRSCLGGGFDHWVYTVVAGLQDDHGGAGIGEFRDVHTQPSEWNGGGSVPGVNWYDVMECSEE